METKSTKDINKSIKTTNDNFLKWLSIKFVVTFLKSHKDDVSVLNNKNSTYRILER